MTSTIHTPTNATVWGNPPSPPADGSYGYQIDVLITPEFAAQLIAANSENQRRAKESRIPGYVRDMRAGKWRARTGEGIKVGTDGYLIDGQNRLRACVIADVPFITDITWNVPPENIEVIDTGSSRTLGDLFKVLHAKDRFISGAVVKWVINFDNGFRTNRGSRVSPTGSEIRDRYLTDPDGFDAAAVRGRQAYHAGMGNPGANGTAYYLFHRIDAEAADRFFDAYTDGGELAPIATPVWQLRRRLGRSSERLSRQQQLYLMIRCWNAWRDAPDVETHEMLLPRQGVTNENFPRPR